MWTQKSYKQYEYIMVRGGFRGEMRWASVRVSTQEAHSDYFLTKMSRELGNIKSPGCIDDSQISSYSFRGGL